jgi:hypothetical protein
MRGDATHTCLLVEARGDIGERYGRVGPVAGNGRDAQADLAAGVLVVRDKLHVRKLTLWDRIGRLYLRDKASRTIDIQTRFTTSK